MRPSLCSRGRGAERVYSELSPSCFLWVVACHLGSNPQFSRFTHKAGVQSHSTNLLHSVSWRRGHSEETWVRVCAGAAGGDSPPRPPPPPAPFRLRVSAVSRAWEAGRGPWVPPTGGGGTKQVFICRVRNVLALLPLFLARV